MRNSKHVRVELKPMTDLDRLRAKRIAADFAHDLVSFVAMLGFIASASVFLLVIAG